MVTHTHTKKEEEQFKQMDLGKDFFFFFLIRRNGL